MLITKCDICNKEIKGEAVFASIGKYFSTQAFCLKCGKPVADFLNKQSKNNKKKNGKQKK